MHKSGAKNLKNVSCYSNVVSINCKPVVHFSWAKQKTKTIQSGLLSSKKSSADLPFAVSYTLCGSRALL